MFSLSEITPKNIRGVDGKTEEEVCRHIESCSTNATLYFAYNSYKALLFIAENDICEKIIIGDFSKALAYLKPLAKSSQVNILKVDLEELSQDAEFSTLTSKRYVKAKCKDLDIWSKNYLKSFSSARGKPLSEKGMMRVWDDAAGCCMYQGCGSFVGETSLTTLNARHGYLAHIIGSAPDGPRGSLANSYQNSDDPENVMLMCDEHHRLIDRIDPDAHEIPILQGMRARHVAVVKELRESIKYQKTNILEIVGDIAGVATSISSRQLREAIFQHGLTPSHIRENFFKESFKDRRNHPDFWDQYLEHISEDIILLKKHLRSTGRLSDSGAPLSIFCIHWMPIAILAGRIIGEARAIQEYHFNRRDWLFKNKEQSPNDDECTFTKERGHAAQQECVLTIEITANLTADHYPVELLNKINQDEVGHYRIHVTVPDKNWPESPKFIEMFRKVTGDALKYLQDELRIKTIHLIPIAPACLALAFGRLLQPGHHSDVVIYDSVPGKKYYPAFTLTGKHVRTFSKPSVAIEL